MLGVVVKGGTGAGRRIIREAAAPWTHYCDGGAWSPPRDGARGFQACVKRCPDCGTRRP